ncbi:MAG: MBL fold metallo-hydrolase [Victivallales bacterium]|nr:MBL fold metallo-hydrolase [Victivallales bacterium]
MEENNQPIGITILGSGSKGNATIIHRGKDAIMIYAGFNKKEFLRRYEAAGLPDDLQIHAILVTHEHTDHICGLRLLAQHFGAQIYATSKCAECLKSRFKVQSRFNLIAAGGGFPLCGFNVTPFSIPHDAVDPIAYTILANNRKIGIATDLGLANTLVSYELKDCDVLVIESNHDLNMLAASQRPWNLKQRIMGNMGHLSNAAAATLLEQVICPNTHHLVLAHLSSECNEPQIAREAACSCLHRLHRDDIDLNIAMQDMPLSTIWLE